MTSPLPRSAEPDPISPLDLTEVADGDQQWVSEPALPAGDSTITDAGAGGRQVLGWTLAVAGLGWVALIAWLAGRSGSSPSELAQWVSLAAGPLALLGLVWLIFGRTRRKEAEGFTRAVQVMRAEARSLEQLLGVLRQRIDDEQAALSSHAERLMRLGDEAGHRLGAVTRDFAAGGETLARHAAALDRAAESARTDIGVLLDDLPRAEASSRAMAEELRSTGREASAQAAALEAQLAAITGRAREAEDVVGGAAQRLVAHLTQIESAGAAASVRVGEIGTNASNDVDALLARTADALGEIRSGLDAQAGAVQALIDQSSASLRVVGQEAAEQLGQRLSAAGGALDGLSSRIAQQDRAATALIAGLERQLAEVDQRFVDLAAEGDLRAQAVTTAIDRVRRELDGLANAQAASGGSLDQLAERTERLHSLLSDLQRGTGDELINALGNAEVGAERLLTTVQAARPEIDSINAAAAEASDKLSASTQSLSDQQERLSALLATLESGAGDAEQRLAALRDALAATFAQAERIDSVTGPALVGAMVRVREAAAQAAMRAREALSAVVPATAQQLSIEAREALSRAVQESVKGQLGEIEQAAAQALEAARTASEGLSRQMLNIGRTAAALEQHLSKTDEQARQADSEAFARRSAVLIDSLHSASIDVGRILSDEVDDRAWAAYLKGDRGVFTRKAVRLLNSAEVRSIEHQVNTDPEFSASVHRYVQDFEAMLRRISGEREGGMMAVTLLSSDMGRLYTALAQVLERRR